MSAFSRWCAVATGLWLTSAHAAAPRPPEAIRREHALLDAEMRDLDRRALSLTEQAQQRAERLHRRVRALYKLSSGGAVRLLAEAKDQVSMAERYDAIHRVLDRDLDELAHVRNEARPLDDEQAERQKAQTRAALLDSDAKTQPPGNVQTWAGNLHRPAAGAVVGQFGPYTEHGIELNRPGIELATAPGAEVSAVAAGEIRFVGERPGWGRLVAIDHGDGFVSFTGHLASVRVQVGEHVDAATPIGRAGARTYFELSQSGTALDPQAWLAPPTRTNRTE